MTGDERLIENMAGGHGKAAWSAEAICNPNSNPQAEYLRVCCAGHNWATLHATTRRLTTDQSQTVSAMVNA